MSVVETAYHEVLQLGIYDREVRLEDGITVQDDDDLVHSTEIDKCGEQIDDVVEDDVPTREPA